MARSSSLLLRMTELTPTSHIHQHAPLFWTLLTYRSIGKSNDSSHTKVLDLTTIWTHYISTATTYSSLTLAHITRQLSTSSTTLKHGRHQQLPSSASLISPTTPSQKPTAPSPSSRWLRKPSHQSYLKILSTWPKCTTSSLPTILVEDQVDLLQIHSCSQFTGHSRNGEKV